MSVKDVTIRSYVKYIALRSYEDVDEEDAVALLTILVETGLVELWKLTGDDVGFDPFVITSRGDAQIFRARAGRITRVTLGDFSEHPWAFHTERVFELLGQLDRLEMLTLYNCASFRLYETVSRFPNLRILDIDCKAITLHPPTNAVKEIEDAPSSNLEHLFLEDYEMTTEDDLGVFLFDVLPFVPKLVEVTVSSNKIQSFQKVAKRIRDGSSNSKSSNRSDLAKELSSGVMTTITPTTSRLRSLNLGRFTYGRFQNAEIVARRQREDPEEVDAIKTLLFAFRELHIIVRDLYIYSMCHWEHNADISYLMEINNAGRVLVERSKEEGQVATTRTSTSDSYTLPLSVLPLVVARAWEKTDERFSSKGDGKRSDFKRGPDGIYYLLRNVEALRTVSQRQKSQRQSRQKR